MARVEALSMHERRDGDPGGVRAAGGGAARPGRRLRPGAGRLVRRGRPADPPRRRGRLRRRRPGLPGQPRRRGRRTHRRGGMGRHARGRPRHPGGPHRAPPRRRHGLLPHAHRRQGGLRQRPRRGAAPLEGYGSRLARSGAGDDGKREWEDYLFHLLHPDARADHARWPAHPPEYVPVTRTFGERVSELASRLLAILSLGLGVPAGTLERRLRLTGDGEEDAALDELLLVLKLKINYYPPCPQPELAVGVEAHTDVSALSFILTNGVPGLQVLRPGHDHWVTARDEPGTLVVHVGDALEILSNGRYTRVLHRGLVNRQAVRVSWVVFAEPPPDSVLLRPLPELVQGDGAKKPRFEPRTFRQHLERKVLKKNDQSEEEEAKKPPVAAQEEEAMKPPVSAVDEEHKLLKKEQNDEEEAMKPPVSAGDEEHKLLKEEQSEEEEATKPPVAPNLVKVN